MITNEGEKTKYLCDFCTHKGDRIKNVSCKDE